MSVPAVNITELDGALGVLPPTSGRLLAVVGPAAAGPIDTPASFAKVADIISNFTRGPAPDAAAHEVERFGRPIVLVRTGASTLGSYLDEVEAEDGEIGAITKTGTGSSVFTDNSSDPLVEADVVVLFVVGGTRGVTGIVYQISLDNGASYGPPQALSTAVFFDVAATGASIAIGAGTIVAGDFISFHLTAPIEASAGEVTWNDEGSVSVPTIDETTHPDDDYEVYIEFVHGGTRGTTGITYKWSLDDGRTMSAETALGTATSIIVPESGGVKVDLSAGTIEAGANLSFPTVAPRWNLTELGTALDALKVTQIAWEEVHIVGPIDADAFDLIDTKLSGMATVGKNRWAFGNTRTPVGDESEATYLSSLSSVFSSKASTYLALGAGAQEMTSSISGRKFKRPISFVAAALEASVTEEVNVGDRKIGRLSCSIRDGNGNPKHHDEAANPGLDDARFYTLRTHEGRAGVYVNLPRLFSPQGSDFELVPHRRVMNITRDALDFYFGDRLNETILVDRRTGFILESEALEIEAGASAILEAVLRAKPKASGYQVTLSRTDVILTTKTLTVQARVIPVGYPRFINLTVGYLNPALQIQQV